MGTPLAEAAEGLRSIGHEATLLVGQGPQPDQILVALGEPGPRQLHAQVMWLPELEDPEVLQTYVGLPGPVESSDLDRVCRFLTVVNGPIPIGAFGLLEDERIVYFRFNQPIGAGGLDLALLSWELSLVDLVVARLGALVEQVATGLSLEEGRERLMTTLAELPA